MNDILLVYGNEGALDDGERDRCYRDSASLARELHRSGRHVAASPLRPVATAASVRVREGRPIGADGPFAETYEQLEGYFLT